MKLNNLIILTTGLSGSSVVTGLIAQDGYWLGDETAFKSNASGHYETYENKRLIALNDELLVLLNIQLDESSWYNAELFNRVVNETKTIDKSKFIDFINYCQQHDRWIWKDPRLWLTLGFWTELLRECDVNFIVITRQPLSLWVSMLNKRQLVGYFELKNLERKSSKRIQDFLASRGLTYSLLNYDQLVEEPQFEIDKLNVFLKSSLGLEDFTQVYHGKIGEKTYDYKKLFKAILIYIKNYHLVNKL
jgi:hypothetical protein